MQREKGTVKFFNPIRLFGFIKGESNNDYFFHINDLPKGYIPKEGDGVKFTPDKVEKGLAAKDIKILRIIR